MREPEIKNTIYFTFSELGVILLLSVLAALTGALVPSWLFPEGWISAFVYSFLGLPGPGAGVIIFGSILCFWLLAGLIVIRKPGTAIAIAVMLIAFDLLFGNQVILFQTLDVLLFVALILEAVSLIPSKWKAGGFIIAAILVGLGAITLVIALAGLATTGEPDIPNTGIPWVYYGAGILGIFWGIISWRYPLRLSFAAGLAMMYYMLHFWLFWGSSFASRFPPDSLMVPVLLLAALLGGMFCALAAAGLDRICRGRKCGRNAPSKDQ